MTEGNGKKYEGIGAIETWVHKCKWLCCVYWEKWNAICQTRAK